MLCISNKGNSKIWKKEALWCLFEVVLHEMAVLPNQLERNINPPHGCNMRDSWWQCWTSLCVWFSARKKNISPPRLCLQDKSKREEVLVMNTLLVTFRLVASQLIIKCNQSRGTSWQVGGEQRGLLHSSEFISLSSTISPWSLSQNRVHFLKTAGRSTLVIMWDLHKFNGICSLSLLRDGRCFWQIPPQPTKARDSLKKTLTRTEKCLNWSPEFEGF